MCVMTKNIVILILLPMLVGITFMHAFGAAKRYLHN